MLDKSDLFLHDSGFVKNIQCAPRKSNTDDAGGHGRPLSGIAMTSREAIMRLTPVIAFPRRRTTGS
jgi:hypothetical protein